MILNNDSRRLSVLAAITRYLCLPIAIEAARVGHRTDLVSRVYVYNPFRRINAK